MSSSDPTKDILEQVLAQLYGKQAEEAERHDGSYLIASDGQLLGMISDNRFDTDSILNKYGPFGSSYSPTSIFNRYSPYGSEYGALSISNPYCASPPKLIINGRLIGRVTENRYISNRISPEAFLYTLKNNLPALLAGNIVESESRARQLERESFIEAGDGTFLGKLNPNKFDSDSVFSKYGPYGNKYSSTSIFNKFSNYGGRFSGLSPYNKLTGTPPKLYVEGKFIGYLTVNKHLSPRIDPDELFNWASRSVRKYG